MAWFERFDDEAGSAAVDFALVSPLVLFLVVAGLQVILTAHVRAVAVAAASAGARVAAAADGSSSAGLQRTSDLLSSQVAPGVVRSIRTSRGSVNGLPVVSMDVALAVPFLGRMADVDMNVTGHALAEGG